MRKITAVLMILCALALTAVQAECLSSQFYIDRWPLVAQPCTTMGATATLPPQTGTNTAPNAATMGPGRPQATPAPTSHPVMQATKAPTATTVKPVATKAPSTVDDYTTGTASAQEQIAFNLLNSDRMANNRQPLTLDPTLCRLARLKSEDMRNNHYFAHESPTYGRVKDMLTTFGYSFNGCGENIGHHANVEKCEAAFLSSSAHRQNIMSTAWTKIGIGIAIDSNGYIYETQIFAR